VSAGTLNTLLGPTTRRDPLRAGSSRKAGIYR
jgi:hypothetical protein